jgi:hypothetical protein
MSGYTPAGPGPLWLQMTQWPPEDGLDAEEKP